MYTIELNNGKVKANVETVKFKNKKGNNMEELIEFLK